MKKSSKWVQLLFLLILFMAVPKGEIFAEDSSAISVKAILPENQHNKEVPYFDLRMAPGQKQELELELTNPTDKDELISLELNDATTNDVGAFDYTNRGKDYKRDDSLKLSVTDVANIQDEVLVKAKTTEIVKIKVEMPEQAFKGLLVGGIRVTQGEKDTEKSDSSNTEIKNKVAYTIGMTLSESDDEVKAELDLLKAFARQTNGRNVIKGNVQNSEPIPLEAITYKAKVTKKGSEKVLHESQVENYRMAPNSNFNFDVSWKNEPFKVGDYTYHLEAESKETGQKWEWQTDFTIKSEEAKNLNKNAVELEKDNHYLLIMIGLLVVVLMGITGFLYSQVTKKKQVKRKKSSKKKRKKKVKKNNKKGVRQK